MFEHCSTYRKTWSAVMRTPGLALLLGLVCRLWATALAAYPALAAPAATELAVPGDFSIADEGPGKLAIRTSPQNLPIYVFDDDVPGKSNCNAGCIGAW